MASDLDADVAAVQRIDAVPRILDVICRTTGMGFAAVARVTEDRWIACAVRDTIQFGLQPSGELKVATTICDGIRRDRAAVVIDNVAEDEVYCGHPTPKMYGFQSYISMPITLADGSFFGTLCAIDPRPARVKNPETIETFRLFAELIAVHLDVTERLVSSEASLLNERDTSELREQFIAILGHDLRNPLASIDAGAKLLLKTPLDSAALRIVTLMQKSVTRMSVLINNVLDLARGRLGGGIVLNLSSNEALEPILIQVVAELRSSHPERTIDVDLRLNAPVICDANRIAELFSNLLGNALTYGARHEPIRVQAATDEGCFELSVSNGGDPIPSGALKRLFQPFTRGAARPTQQGLGLGLYIASEIAAAHAGTLEVTSVPAETRFTFRMPRAALRDPGERTS
jgi:signal transduction histidine kinase